MIGRSSSLMMRWACGVVRERFQVATSSLFSAPILFNRIVGQSHQPQFLPSIAPCGVGTTFTPLPEVADQHIWFAVPKSKISRSRKRMKNTRQKRIPLKKNIVFDPRTGEVTLKHKMPFNWKDYLPKVD